MTIAMKPWPCVMNGVEEARPPGSTGRRRPARHRPPEEDGLAARALTLTPAASSAAGFSPAARMFRPMWVLRNVHATTATRIRPR